MTTKKSTKKIAQTKVVSVGEQRDKNLEVAKVIVAVQHFDSGVAQWNGVDGKTYYFTRDVTLGKHILEFDSIEEYEAERENLIHNKHHYNLQHQDHYKVLHNLLYQHNRLHYQLPNLYKLLDIQNQQQVSNRQVD